MPCHDKNTPEATYTTDDKQGSSEKYAASQGMTLVEKKLRYRIRESLVRMIFYKFSKPNESQQNKEKLISIGRKHPAMAAMIKEELNNILTFMAKHHLDDKNTTIPANDKKL